MVDLKNKKILIISIVVLVVLLLIIRSEYVKIIGNTTLITAKTVYDSVSFSLTVNTPPQVYISFPLNATYNFDENISFQFYAIDPDQTMTNYWYSLNNNNNVTIADNATIDAVDGTNTIRLYANDSLGSVNSTTVFFSVNESDDYDVDYGHYNNNGGSTTNFSSLDTKFSQEKIANLTLEIPGYGKIVFSSVINLSEYNGEGFQVMNSRKLFNFSNISRIQANKVRVDSHYARQLNKSATIYLYSITLNSPKIQRDGADCPESICDITNYTLNTLTFTVPYFSEYEAVGSGSGSSGSAASQGGGGSKKEELPFIEPTGKVIKEKLPVISLPKPVKVPGALFNFKISIPLRSFVTYSASTLPATVKFSSPNGLIETKLLINYKIKNKNNEIVLTEEDSLNVTTQYTEIKRFRLPEEIIPGYHILEAEASYNNETVKSSAAFFAIKEQDYWRYLNITVAVILLLILFYFIQRKIYSHKNHK